MAHETVILTHTIHHPTQGGEIRVLQEVSDGYTYLHLDSDSNIPQYSDWSQGFYNTPEKTYTEQEIKEAGYKLLLAFIGAAYIENED